MGILSPLRSRRLAQQQTEATQHLLVFRIRQELFSLPTKSVQKVLPMPNVYGDPQSTGVSVAIYQDKELLVVDVGRRIFRETIPQPLSPSTSNSSVVPQPKDSKEQRFLLIVQSSQGQLVGLPIDSLPLLRRVPESAFAPLPSGYTSEANIQCVSSLMVQSQGDEPPLFLLNPDQLAQPQQIVPLAG